MIMTEEITYFINTLVAIFVIVDPFAVIPVYLILTERFSDTNVGRSAENQQ